MNRSKTYPYAMTLRLSIPMQTEVENRAYECRMSKAGFIRRCIRLGISDAYDRGTQNLGFQKEGGAL